MNKFRYIITTLCMVLLSLAAQAAVKIDGIWYELKQDGATVVYEATVTSCQDGTEYSGNINIPYTIEYEGISYDVTTIGNDAFSHCNDLTSVFIPNSVTSIGDKAFYICYGLTSVIIPNSVTSIGYEAFKWCPYLIRSAYPKILKNPFESGFSVAYDPASAIFENGFIWGPDKSSILFAPLTLDGEYIIPNSVTSIGDDAFSSCIGLSRVTIPNSVTSIGNRAFGYCYKLTSVSIPNSVTSIGENAFDNCHGLTSVTIPNSVTSIGNSAFFGCSGLTSVTIPNTVTSIGDNTFSSCSCLRRVTIPNSVTSIGNSAFLGCSGLTSVTIPNSVTSIGNNAFFRCYSLTSVTIPNSVTSIGNEVFQDCSKLKSITIPNSVTSIGNSAFYGCYCLTSVPIPNSVTSIGNSAFQGCNSLTSVTIPNSVTSIGEYAFSECPNLSSVEIGSGVKKIGKSTFEKCGLSQVVLPPSVETIGMLAFADNSYLKVVAMGPNVKNIDDFAFDNAPIESMFITAQEPPMATDMSFSSYDGNFFVHGQKAVDAYSNASTCWNQFKVSRMSEPTGLTIADPEALPKKAGDTVALRATLTPINVDLPYVFWRSTNPEKATVDNNGVVTLLQDYEEGDDWKIIAETLYHNGPTAIFSLNNNISTGVDEILGETTSAMDVFTLQGVLVLRNATREQFDNLASGIYIVRNGKVVKKVVK